MSSSTGLVVPVDVVAFCVSEADEQEATGNFAGATVVYTNQTDSTTPAYLGANVNRGFTAPPWQRLEAGVHVQWALPDALTKAAVDETQTSVNFPAAPNRWLVTRFVMNGATPSATSWVVESDALNTSVPTGQIAVTVPVQPGSSGGQDFRYLGQTTALSGYAPATLLNGTRSFAQATGAELSAVSNGVPTFASFYPESRSVFGFVDTLAGISGTADLMYVVTGWYDATGNDPMSQSANLQASHGWAAAAEDPPAYTLYSGTVQDVAWDPTRDYVLNQPGQLPISAAAAIGNTPSEALSAYFTALDAQPPLFEQLLNALQLGLLARLSQPAAGQLAQLAEQLHDNQFQATDAGLIYTVVRADDTSGPQVSNLPMLLADALNQLNNAAQALQEATATVLSFQWRMFADWYRYFQANTNLNSAVFNNASGLYGDWIAPQTGLAAQYAAAQANFQTQLTATQALLDSTLTLKPVPAPRYWQPTDPAVLLASPDLAFPLRYGGDGAYSSDGTLLCRPTDQLVTQVTVSTTTIDASQFASQTSLPTGKLPYSDACSALLAEACLLNTQIAASLSGQTDAALQTALTALLNGQAQSLWVIDTGTAPSPVAYGWWGPNNPWLPLFLQWVVEFVPLQPTQTGTTLENYTPEFFTANYTVDPETGSFLSYTPDGGQYSIQLDPATANYAPNYGGQSILSSTAAQNLATAITGFTQKYPDSALQTVWQQLQATPTLVQPMSGFTDALLMQQQIVQLQIAVPAGGPYLSQQITTETKTVVGNYYHIGPQFGGSYNPIRAGYFKVTLQAIDMFGQKRDVNLTSIVQSEAMTALSGGQPVPGVSYAAPRLAQASRLLFDWISADAASLVEMNAIPASTPVCGWLLPNHLDGGFFLYDGAGKPLGMLQLNGDQSAVIWQSAPGNDATINLPIAQALADANPVLNALALSLYNGTPAYFLAFWQAVDEVHGGISPDLAAANAGLAVLIGRPVAVVQAALRLDLNGRPALNQSWACLSSSAWTDTDNGFSSVQFPVVLGDIDRLDDGLVGYFRQAAKSYDFSTFYTAGAAPGARSGVVQPTQSNLLLTCSPKFDDPEPPPVADETIRVLMLVDPRAKVHAVTGILPTQTLQIPPDVAAAAISTLEMSFLVAPVLEPASQFALPVPVENGYAVSWVQENLSSSQTPEWYTISDISAPNSTAVWDYSPQGLTEGYMRLNPTLLSFDLLNAQGQALVTGGATQSMTLRVTNRKPAAVTFNPGVLQPEGDPPPGSVLYFHFGNLVAQADIPAMGFSAAGWNFAAENDAQYGQYWAATPSAAVTLAAGGSFDIAITRLTAVNNAVQAQIYADYYDLDGVNDGVFADLVTISQQNS